MHIFILGLMWSMYNDGKILKLPHPNKDLM